VTEGEPEDADDADDKKERRRRAVAAASGAFLGAVVAGPAGVILGAGLGPLLEPLIQGVWTELAEAVKRRHLRMLESTVEAGVPVDELGKRINASERTQLLTGSALSAAGRTAWEDKVRTLGRSLASGLLAEDDATIDTEQMIIAALADIEAPQLAMLELLVAYRPGRHTAEPLVSGPLDLPKDSHHLPYSKNWGVAWRDWSRGQIEHARPKLAPLTPALLGTLQRNGLAVQNDNADETVERLRKAVESAFNEMYAYVRAGGGYSARGGPKLSARGVAQEPSWSPTELGEQVFLRFRDAGTELEDVWTSGPAGQQETGTAPEPVRGQDAPPSGTP
jgi:hypothetical protein